MALAVCSVAARAGDKPLIAPTPAWVSPPPAMPLDQLAADGVDVPLIDFQLNLEKDKVTTFIDGVLRIKTPEALGQFGTVNLQWQPSKGDLTVHRVEIIRDGKVIDVLGNGSKLTVLQREARLEQRVVDGTLTAMMQVEGLRVGDALRVTHSISMHDDVLAGHVQGFAQLLAGPGTLRFGRSRIVWDADVNPTLKALAPGLDLTARNIAGNRREVVLTLPVPKLPEMPDAVPSRFRPIPAIEVGNFKDWAQVSSIMAAQYRTEGTIPGDSALAKLVDGIAAAHADPRARIAEALRVVQSDVRYQLIALGNGNYQPQSPTETWTKRYGDCKAKSLLLTAMLRRMGITADPVMAHSQLGDLVPQRIASPLAFDHVIVRAQTGGKTYWLDGTSLGSREADLDDVPRFGWVLPVLEKDAALVRLPDRANARFGQDMRLSFDGTASVHLPSPYTFTVTYSGPQAESMRGQHEGNPETLTRFADDVAQSMIGYAIVDKPLTRFDQASGTYTVTFNGVGSPTPFFRDGRYHLQLGSWLKIPFKPDRSRTAWREFPASLTDPQTQRAQWQIRFPERASGFEMVKGDPVRLNNPAFVYERDIKVDGLSVTDYEIKRETAAEIAPAAIGATRKAAADAGGRLVEVVLPSSYPARWSDLAAAMASPALARVRHIVDRRIADKPDDAARYADRAWLHERLFEWTAAEADYGKAVALDPTIDRYMSRSRARLTRNNLPGALADAREAYALDNANQEASDLLADILAQTGKFDEALALLDPDPDLSVEGGDDKVTFRAEILARAGRLEDLDTLLSDAIGRRPSLASLRNVRCWTNGLLNRELEAALSDCDRAIELASDPAGYYDSRGMVHFRAGRLAEARKDYDSALALSPELAATRFMRSIVAAKQGDAALARDDLAAARLLSPSIDRFFAAFGIKP